MKYIVVFDTNILLSALFSQTGNPFQCLALAKIGQVESITCQEILDEFDDREAFYQYVDRLQSYPSSQVYPNSLSPDEIQQVILTHIQQKRNRK